MENRETFLQIHMLPLQLLIQELNFPWKKTIEEPRHLSAAEKSERPEQNRDLRCQSGPSAKDSVIFSGGDFSKNYWADQQRLQISDLHFDNLCLLEDEVQDRGVCLFTISYGGDAMDQRSELVETVDELKSSSSTRGISMPNFEVLDARIASAPNKIIHNTHFKRKISLEEQKAQKEDRVLRGRQTDCLLDLRVLPGHWNR